mgnify:FL=1
MNNSTAMHPMVMCLLAFLLSSTAAMAQNWYTVLPGDNQDRIARENDLTASELALANPEVMFPLSPGDELWIPAPVELLQGMDQIYWAGDTYSVLAGDTWYGIARQFGISDPELRAANEGIQETLSIGDKLQVPKFLLGNQNAVGDVLRENRFSGDTAKTNGASALSHLPVLPADTLRVLAMLPFMLEVDTVKGGDYDMKTTRLRDIALDFYHGIEWAAQLLQDSGYAVQVNLVDTEPDTLGVYSWGASDLYRSNVVLGPLRSNRMDSVNQMLSETSIPQWILTALKPAVWSHHKLSFSLRSDEREGLRQLGSLVARSHPLDTVLLLETRGKDAALETAFKEGYISVRGSLEGLESLPANRQFAEGFTSRMDTSKLNVVAIPSGKSSQSLYAYVQTELQLADSFPVRVYAHPVTAELEFMERDFMNRCNLTVPVSARIDWDHPSIQRQTKRFRKMYGTDPGTYSIIAFDAMLESAQWMDSNGQTPALPKPIQYATQWKWDPVAKSLVNCDWELRMFSNRLIKIDY